MQIFGYNISKAKEKTLSQKEISTEQLRYYSTQYVNEILNNSINWIPLRETRQFINAWHKIPDLRTIISKLSNYFTRFELIHYKKTSDGLVQIEDSPLIKLFNSPNGYQNRNEFFAQNYAFYKVTGNSFIYSNMPAGFNNDYENIKSLHNINPVDIVPAFFKKKEIVTTNFIEEILRNYDYKGSVEGKDIQIEVEKIIHLNESNILTGLENKILGNSKLNSLRYQLTNLGVAYEAKQVLLRKRGALGMFTTNGAGGQYAFPLTPDEQKKMQDQWQSYGLTSEQWQVLFTKASLTWQQISMNSRDLQIYESLEDDRKSLCAAYSLPYLLFITGGGEGSTYANLDTASKQVYREAIIPDWEAYQNNLNKFFRLQEKNELLVFSYEHIDVLQEDEKEKQEKQKIQIESINSVLSQYNANQLSYEQAYNILIEVMHLPQSLVENILIKPVIENNEESEITEENETEQTE
ncbi:MAG: phage portal protein [Candidatus Lokiarchaeota archaeon]|nr:phage portal protein [Candidatus Lokiarchaeota archaeon]